MSSFVPILTLRLLRTVLIGSSVAFGALVVGAALADIVWADEPDLAVEWAVVIVSVCVAILYSVVRHSPRTQSRRA